MSRLDVKRVQKRSTNVVLSKHQIWLKKRMIPRKELKYIMWVIHIHSYISITACKIRDMELTISFKTNKYMIQKRLFEFVATVTIYPDGKSFFFFNYIFFAIVIIYYSKLLCTCLEVIYHTLLKKLNHFVATVSTW